MTGKSRRIPDPEEEPTISIARAAAILGIGKTKCYESAANGEIPVIKVGRRHVVPTARLLRMLGIGDVV